VYFQYIVLLIKKKKKKKTSQIIKDEKLDRAKMKNRKKDEKRVTYFVRAQICA